MEFYFHDRDRKDGICGNSYAVVRLDLYSLIADNLQEIEYDVPVMPLIATRDNWVKRKIEHIYIMKPEQRAALTVPKPDSEPVKETKKSAKSKKKL